MKLYKKAQVQEGVKWQFRFLSQLMISVAVVLIPLLLIANLIGESSTFNQNFLVRDIGLQITNIYYLPGEIEFTYPEDLKDYEVSINNNIVMVRHKDNKIGGKYNLLEPKIKNNLISFTGGEKLIIKNKNGITITKK